jgi:type III secretory pathway component EscT
MGAGTRFLVLAMLASLILPGDFTSLGPLAQVTALAILSLQWVIVGALIGWLLGLLINALRSSQREAI